MASSPRAQCPPQCWSRRRACRVSPPVADPRRWGMHTSPLPPCAGQSQLTEASTFPRPNGEREGPALQAREGEGDAQLSRCFLKQTSLPLLPLTFPSLMRWVPSSPRGERRKRTPLPNAIALPARGEGEEGQHRLNPLPPCGRGIWWGVPRARISPVPSQSQYRLRDDVLLDLVRAAIEPDLAPVQIGR